MEAETIAKALVEERLAACCSLIPGVRSFYKWEDTLQNDEECLILCKTLEEVFPILERRVKELHSYDVPELILTPVTMGLKDYLDWLGKSVGAIRVN